MRGTIGIHVDAFAYLTYMYDNCIMACGLFEMGLPRQVGKALIASTAKVKKILLAQHPGSFVDILTLILEMRRRNKEEVALCMLSHFKELGKAFSASTTHAVLCADGLRSYARKSAI